MSSTSFSDKDEPAAKLLSVEASGADPLYTFLRDNADVPEATSAQNRRLKRRFYIHLVPIVFCLNLLLYIDKATLGQSSVLGILEDAHIDSAQYDNLNTFFYVGFGAGLWPTGYLLQRLPVGRYVAWTVVAWGIIIALHTPAKSYAGLAVLRTALGVVESGILPSIVVILNMWFTHAEQMILVNVWYMANSLASVPVGFTAYGALYYVGHTLHPWQLFYLVLAGLTFAYSFVLFFFLPDNPSKARFLTTEEKVHAIRRLRVNNGSIETKVWKKEQFLETLRDPKAWLFVLHVFCNQIPNNLGNQYPLLIVGYGFTELDSTLMSAAFAIPPLVGQLGATIMLSYWKGKNAIAWIAIFWYLPDLVGGILQLTLPIENKHGLLVGLYMASMFGVPWAMSLTWASIASTGHTKKITQTQMFLFGYVASNLISPQLWQSKYLPRYYVPWALQVGFGWVAAPAILLVIRWYLARENKRRAALLAAEGGNTEGVGKVIETDEDGNVVETIIDRGMLDLTDFQDLSYVYPL